MIASAQGTRLLEEFFSVPLQYSHWSTLRVNGLAVDSRSIKPGSGFIAYPGHFADGRQFIDAALVNGAVVVLAEADNLQVKAGQPVIPVPNLKQQLGAIASAFYGDPSRQLKLFAVTGTNGKTTVTQLIAGALQHAGINAGLIGTLGNGLVGQLQATDNTTPDIIEINRLLAEMSAQAIEVVAMEASSHGLVQGRLDGLALQTAIVTNLSRDHLDYHGTMQAYRDAKALLVKHPVLSSLVLNADDPAVAAMEKEAAQCVSVITFSMNPNAGATVVAENLQFETSGIRCVVRVGDDRSELNSPLVGAFNAANLLAAVAGLLSLGVEISQACDWLSAVAPVVGRMQMINLQKLESEPAVIVDFAHTPDALEKALQALRCHSEGKIWCVFGCGGDRDAGKRPLMGEVVARCADEVVVTTDNSRTEKPGRIMGDIVKGIPQKCSFQIIEDRAQAVEYAVMNAGRNDMVLLAGKGHELYQDIGGIKYPYSDAEAAMAALRKRRNSQSEIDG